MVLSKLKERQVVRHPRWYSQNLLDLGQHLAQRRIAPERNLSQALTFQQKIQRLGKMLMLPPQQIHQPHTIGL